MSEQLWAAFHTALSAPTINTNVKNMASENLVPMWHLPRRIFAQDGCFVSEDVIWGLVPDLWSIFPSTPLRLSPPPPCWDSKTFLVLAYERSHWALCGWTLPQVFPGFTILIKPFVLHDLFSLTKTTFPLMVPETFSARNHFQGTKPPFLYTYASFAWLGLTQLHHSRD